MPKWTGSLRFDAVNPLLRSDHPAIAYLAGRDLAGVDAGSVRELWDLPECQAILRRQRPDGSWRYPGGGARIRSMVDYEQLETYRQLGVLVEKFELDRRHPAIKRAARFLLSFQTDAGDIRGIYGRQYSPNYSAAITELLVKAGYGSSRQISQSIRWLMSIRQDDGGWALPLRTRGRSLDVVSMRGEPLEPVRSKPSSHLITGIVLRALAAHSKWRLSSETKRAGELLKSRFFSPDRYPDHRPAAHWLTFSYPFWWTDLVSALDSLTRAGFTSDDRAIARGVEWLIEHQEKNGLWHSGRNRPKGPYTDQWVALAICRLLQRASGE
jgi:hypothetical protein